MTDTLFRLIVFILLQGEKSTSQKAGDTLSGNSNENDVSLYFSTHFISYPITCFDNRNAYSLFLQKSMLDKTKNALGMGEK